MATDWIFGGELMRVHRVLYRISVALAAEHEFLLIQVVTFILGSVPPYVSVTFSSRSCFFVGPFCKHTSERRKEKGSDPGSAWKGEKGRLYLKTDS